MTSSYIKYTKLATPATRYDIIRKVDTLRHDPYGASTPHCKEEAELKLWEFQPRDLNDTVQNYENTAIRVLGAA